MSRLSDAIRRLPGLRGKRRPRWQRKDLDRKCSYALNDLDLKLEKHLGSHTGFFIEAGANDGISQSNTLFFEKYHGWTGLLVEPVNELAKRCRANRPDCIVENTALVAFDYPGSTVEMRYCNLMSLVRGAMKSDAEEEAHLQRGCDVQGIGSYDLQVPATQLSALLDRHGIRQVDLLSLDVEGYELSVLQGLDFERHAPSWLLIEARFRKEIDDYLDPRYEVAEELSHHDVLYRRR